MVKAISQAAMLAVSLLFWMLVVIAPMYVSGCSLITIKPGAGAASPTLPPIPPLPPKQPVPAVKGVSPCSYALCLDEAGLKSLDQALMIPRDDANACRTAYQKVMDENVKLLGH